MGYCKLIADAGSTKTDWALVNDRGKIVMGCATKGMNPLTCTADELAGEARVVSKHLGNRNIEGLWFYGAGCASKSLCGSMANLLESELPVNHAEVASDMLGAARALLGNKSGMACIMGSGSNSCLYDGHEIVGKIPSLGFILGDEGSGASLGKRLLADRLKCQMPQDLAETFDSTYPSVNADEVIRRVYREPSPNRWLASFAPFLSEHIGVPYIEALVADEFRRFIERNLKPYGMPNGTEVGFIGSIAVVFRPLLERALSDRGWRLGKVMAAPLEGLVKYHCQ